MTLTIAKTEILDACDPIDSAYWNRLVDRAPVPDVYYRPGYARAYEVAGHGKAVGVLIAADEMQMLVPLLLRPLSDLSFAQGESGFDAFTPYGYGGLLPLTHQQPHETDARAFLDALRQWCRDSGVVACFVRLHPLLHQERWLDCIRSLGPAVSLCFHAETAAIDLSDWDSSLQRIVGMSQNRRVALNRAKRCLGVSWGGSEIPVAEALNLFHRIYGHRMTQLNASSFYHFPVEYYLSLAAELGDKLGVALAWMGDELLGAHLFLADGHFAHYHLGGTNEKGLELNAPTLLINAGAQWARERGCKILHLGGGIGGSNGLLNYKKSYGGPSFSYHTLNVVADETRYHDLLAMRLNWPSLPALREGYFPQYRG